MRLTFETILESSRAMVWRVFDNPENLKKWQPTLVRFTPRSGTPGQVGAVSELEYEEGGRTIVLVETITSRTEPEEFSGVYQSSHGRNTIRNRFQELDAGRTSWTIDAEFQSKGIFWLLSPLFRKMIRRRLNDDIARFKAKLEAGDLG